MPAHPEPHEQRVEKLIAAFEREFGRRPEGIAEAPGRVNLIGEHVDYNDGLVLPFAIERSVLCAWGPPEAWMNRIHALSVDYGESCPVPMYGNDPLSPREWYDYVLGMLVQAKQLAFGFPQAALTIAIEGDVPQGAGLSSSAALEMAVGGALRSGLAVAATNVELAQMGQRAESKHVGVQCGIMDQFASALSKRDHALLIDCRTLAYRHIPLRLDAAGLAIVVANSARPRRLASSAFNERRRECEDAVVMLCERLGRPDLASLRDVTDAEIEGIEIDAVPLRRARHVVTEIARVAAAVEALERDDFEALGQLMVDSHLSLRHDYDVSSEQLDVLVGLATAQDYVLGARLTGAGFGGCTVNLVRADAIDAFERDVVSAYRERTGLPAEMYVTKACDGLRTWRV